MKNIWKDLRINPAEQNIKDKPEYIIFPGVPHTKPYECCEIS